MTGTGRNTETAHFDIWVEGTYEHIELTTAKFFDHSGLLMPGLV